MSEIENILQHELEMEMEEQDPDAFEMTEEEEAELQAEMSEWRDNLNDANDRIRKADYIEEFAEAIVDALNIALDANKEYVFVRPPDHDKNDSGTWIVGWEGGPYNWAVEMLGESGYFGIEGYLENENFHLEAQRSFSLSITEAR